MVARGFCGNLGDPVISTGNRRREHKGEPLAPGWPPTTTPRPCVGASAVAWEQSPDATVVPSIAKENEAAAGRMAGSLSVLIVPAKRGERAIDRHPAEGRKTPEHGTVFGNYDGCIEIRTSYQ